MFTVIIINKFSIINKILTKFILIKIETNRIYEDQYIDFINERLFLFSNFYFQNKTYFFNLCNQITHFFILKFSCLKKVMQIRLNPKEIEMLCYTYPKTKWKMNWMTHRTIGNIRSSSPSNKAGRAYLWNRTIGRSVLYINYVWTSQGTIGRSIPEMNRILTRDHRLVGPRDESHPHMGPSVDRSQRWIASSQGAIGRSIPQMNCVTP